MDSLQFLQGDSISPNRVRLFHITFSLAGCALFAATWQLWLPQQAFPQVPLLSFFGTLPAFLQTVAATLVIASLLTLGVLAVGRPEANRKYPSIALLTFALSAALLILTDQHRLQPWAYQWIIFAIVLAVLPADRAFVLLRWIVVSIYFWSAVAKLDYSFVDTLGQQFLSSGLGLFGVGIENWQPATRHAAALVFPLIELLIAAGFCLPLQRFTWLRRGLLSMVVVMHGLLILILSPLGLHHEPAVIIWNLWFIGQALLLFGFPATKPEEFHARPLAAWQEFSGVLVEFFVAAVILLPVLTLFQRFDHWLAWGLYAPRNSRATLYIHESEVDRLPESLQTHISDTPRGDGWRQLRIDSWSLDALAVPIYPQDRFQVGVADAVIRQFELQNDFQLIVEAPPDRLTGRRASQTIRTAAALDTQLRGYWLNTRSGERGVLAP